MMNISTGEPSTLGTYRKIAYVVGGMTEDSAPVKFIDSQIAGAPDGADEEVIADESQMLYLLATLAIDELSGRGQGNA